MIIQVSWFYQKLGLSVLIVVQSLSCIQLFKTPWTPRFPVLSYLLGFAQTHIHWVGDAIQPSHLLLPSSPPVLNLSQYQGLFQWTGSSNQVAKVLKLQHQSFQWVLRVVKFVHFTKCLPEGCVGLKSSQYCAHQAMQPGAEIFPEAGLPYISLRHWDLPSWAPIGLGLYFF